jgi:biotin carboxyl carrier protein
MIYHVKLSEGPLSKPRLLDLKKPDSEWDCRLDGEVIPIDAVLVQPDVLSIVVKGHAYEVKRERTGTKTNIWVGDRCFEIELRDPRSLRSRNKGAVDEAGPQKIVAPMPGRVVRILISENSPIDAGQGVVVVEAMKMQNEIKSPKKGAIRKIMTTPGAAVNPGDVLAIVE